MSHWKNLDTPDDIDELMRLFGNFHDACVREIHIANGNYVTRDFSMHVNCKTTAHLLIQRQFAGLSAIELRCEDLTGLGISPEASENILFEAALFLLDGVSYWADRCDWTPGSAAGGGATWVAARRMSWRDASDWMGPEPRYRLPG